MTARCERPLGLRCLGRALAIAGFLVSATAALGQSSASSLRGDVADPAGAAIAGAQVVLRNSATGFSTARVTDSRGEYRFFEIPSGAYAIAVTAAGFAPQSRLAQLPVNQPVTQDFSLSVQQLLTRVQVNGEAPGLNFVDASLGNAVADATIQALPMEGRNVPDLLSLQPGVLYLGGANDQSRDSRSGASSGGRSDQGNLTLDGVDDNDQARGYAFDGALRSTLESVQEFRVTTDGFGADSGRSSGAQAGLVTRSGSNRLHGSLYEYNRSSIGEANDWFNKQAELSSGLPNKPGKLIRNTFGASLGGPIRRDKAFFFANYEGQRTAENLQRTATVPALAMRAGNIQYSSSAQGSAVLLDPAQIAVMDPACTATCNRPWGPGVDPNVLAVLQLYPAPNGTASGDGLNTASYSWSAPDPASLNTYIARFDYLPSHRHWIFVRGNLQNDRTSAAPQFPGQPASAIGSDDSKGIAAGDRWEISSNLVENLRFGFTRQGYASRGIGQGQYANFYNISPLYAESRSTLVDVPVANAVDDLSWTRGAHSIQAGANYRLIYNHRRSDASSYSYGYTNAYALAQAGIANTGQSFDPAAFGFPAVAANFANSYNFAMGNLAGLLDLVTTQSNYSIAGDGTTASLLPSGAMLGRAFKNNEFEYYLQDAWRLRPRLTLTFGLRHTLLQTPFEVRGQQAQPTVNIDRWFKTRGEQAALGNSVQPDLSFAPSGRARGLKPYWPMQLGNLAPRVAVVLSSGGGTGLWRSIFGAAGESAIRAGYGIYYDHFGEGIVDSFDRYGSFGLSDSIANPTNLLTPSTSPRFTGIHDLPSITGAPASAIAYPALAPNDPLWTGFEIAHGLDDRMKTPYSQVVDLSFQRQLRGFVLEVAYIGRFGRHQLQQIDLAEPLDPVDARSGQDYFAAATQLSKQKYAGAANVAAIPYFEDMFPDAAGGGLSATQNIYNQVWFPGNETGSLYMLDVLCTPGCGGATNRFWPRQYASMYAWSSIGNGSYNAGQVALRRRMGDGLQMELSYTLSKSIDMGSDTERTLFSSSTGTSAGSSFGAILNAWNPRLNRAVSDFDVRHLVAGNWVAELPVGRGRALLGDSGRAVNAAIGDWRLSGVGRWTSGLPFSVVSGAGWGTDWDEQSDMVQTGPIQTHTHMDRGEAQVFADPVKALQNLRNPYPGEAGQRNNFRGDGYFAVDGELSKNWKIRDGAGVRFAWEVFNATNSVRFDVNPLNSLQNSTAGGELGVYGATLTKPRVQQFSLRYSF
jgi:hypothetical protein